MVGNDTMSTSSSTTTSPGNNAPHLTFGEQLESFDFRGDAIDMALRKLLAKAHLPKEAQEIDRAMEDFAKRYHECNPDLADSPDAAYAVAFSLLLLHTDAHNKNVRQKMNKDTFIMRTRIIEGGEDVPVEILDIMYDNIVSTEFTYAEEEDPSKPRTPTSWFGRLAKSDSSHALSAANTIEDLYPKLTQLMPPENTFCYKRALRPIQLHDAHMAFHHAKPLVLGGVRSRHTNDGSNTYTIRVAKAAILERKYDLLPGGKKTTVRGWRPFGVILSGSQIIFFGDVLAFDTWLTQERPFQFPTASTSTFNTQSPSFTSSIYSTQSLSNSIAPIPATSNLLRPVQIISLADAVCIYDESYTKYPNVFRLMTGDGQIFLIRAKSNGDLDDWMTKINYASTTKTTNIRLRPSSRSKREDKAKAIIMELSQKMVELERMLEKDLRLRRNLMVLQPFQKTSKERILYFGQLTGKRIYAKRLEMQRLECYREFLEVTFNEQTPRKLSVPLLSRAPPPHRSATSPALSTLPASPMSYDEVMWTEKSASSSTEMLKPLDDERNSRRSSCPQIPPFPFALEELPLEKHKDKTVAFDVPSTESDSKTSKWMRRRSSSNPVKPINDGKMGRERSGSEASSVRDDDELTIVNATDEEKPLD